MAHHDLPITCPLMDHGSPCWVLTGPWLGIAGHSWTMAGHDWTWLELTCRLQLLTTAGPGWTWLDLVGWPLLAVAAPGWTLLDLVGWP